MPSPLAQRSLGVFTWAAGLSGAWWVAYYHGSAVVYRGNSSQPPQESPCHPNQKFVLEKITKQKIVLVLRVSGY